MTERDSAAKPRDEPDVCMVYDDHGNAFHCFDYTADALEAEARMLREEAGELSHVTVAPSPFVVRAAGTAASSSAAVTGEGQHG